MWLNILIAIIIGLSTYGLTLYYDHRSAPQIEIINAPVETSINMDNTAKPMPDFTFTALNKETLSTADFRGKIIILNFWATWCAPCIKEFPALLDIAASYNEDVIFIAVSSDISEEPMLKFLDKMTKDGFDTNAANIFVTRDTNNAITRDIFQTYRLPETIIIDRNGIMRRKLIGINWDPAAINNLIQKL